MDKLCQKFLRSIAFRILKQQAAAESPQVAEESGADEAGDLWVEETRQQPYGLRWFWQRFVRNCNGSRRQYAFALQGIAKRHFRRKVFQNVWSSWVAFLGRLKRFRDFTQKMNRMRIKVIGSWVFWRLKEEAVAVGIKREAVERWKVLKGVNAELGELVRRWRRVNTNLVILRRVFESWWNCVLVYEVSERGSDCYLDDCEDLTTSSSLSSLSDISMLTFRQDFVSKARVERIAREDKLMYGEDEVDASWEKQKLTDSFEMEYASSRVDQAPSQAQMRLGSPKRGFIRKPFSESRHNSLLRQLDSQYEFDKAVGDLQSSSRGHMDGYFTPGFAKHRNLLSKLDESIAQKHEDSTRMT